MNKRDAREQTIQDFVTAAELFSDEEFDAEQMRKVYDAVIDRYEAYQDTEIPQWPDGSDSGGGQT